MKTSLASSVAGVLLVFLSSAAGVLAQGSIVWNGPITTFTLGSTADWTQPANQDQITGNVWITRNGKHGIFNAASEGGYVGGTSPADTEWAIGALANYSSLTYSDWATCYGGAGALKNNIVGTDAVMHLITDDIYIGVKFTSWGASAGGFQYQRTTAAAVPEPAAGALGIAVAGLLLGTAVRRKLRGGK